MSPVHPDIRLPPFERLPAYADFLAKHHLRELAVFLLDASRRLQLPLLRYFEQLPEEELLSLSMEGNRALLEAIAGGKAAEYIAGSHRAWVENRLPGIQSGDVAVEDISGVSYVRRQGLRHFLFRYTQDADCLAEIMDEVDRFIHLQENLSYKTLLQLKEQAVLDSEAASRHLIGHAPEAIIVIDKDSRILLWNPRAEAIFGWSPAEVTGVCLTDTIIPPAYREAHRAGMHRLQSTGESRILNTPLEIQALRKSGDTFHISLAISQSARAGEPVYIAFLRDISQERATAQELEEQRRELTQKNLALERSNEELSAFNYIASHDLKEPVRKVKLYIDRLRHTGAQADPQRMADGLARIAASADHMDKLIEALLVYSRTGQASEYELVDLRAVIDRVLQSLRDRAEALGATVTAGALPVISAIPVLMHQLFENLIGNALKYHRSGQPPVVRITARRVRGAESGIAGADPAMDYHGIAVADNGIGFEQQYAEQVFEVFQRLHGKDVFEGTGIGLAICRKIAHLHHGFIRAEGRPGEGALFEVFLPANQSRLR